MANNNRNHINNRKKGLAGFQEVAGGNTNTVNNEVVEDNKDITEDEIVEDIKDTDTEEIADKNVDDSKDDSKTDTDSDILGSVKAMLERESSKPKIVSRQFYLEADVVKALDKLDKGNRNKSKIVNSLLKEAFKKLELM